MSSRTCLIVDDDAGLRRVILHSVRKFDFDPVECVSLKQAMAAFQANGADLIFLDVGLGDGEASQLLNFLADRHADCQIVLVSGRSAEELEVIEDMGSDLGLFMLPSLTKPFRSEALRAVLKDVGGLARGAAS